MVLFRAPPRVAGFPLDFLIWFSITYLSVCALPKFFLNGRRIRYFSGSDSRPQPPGAGFIIMEDRYPCTPRFLPRRST
jgi:hypothetical protein